MKRSPLVLLIAPIQVLASDPFACVSPDAADAFLGGWYQGPPTYSTSPPAGFPVAELPSSLELIGSSVADSGTGVVYKSKDTPTEALALAVEALQNAGWEDQTGLSSYRRGGFHVVERPIGTVLCNASGTESISIMAKEGVSNTLLRLSTHGQPQRNVCGQEQPDPRARGPALAKYLPVLKLPEDARASRTGSGGGGDEYSARVVVSSPLSRSALITHLDEQVRAQEWNSDAGWTGSTSSGSVWTKTDEDGFGMVGVLRIADAGADVYNVRFTVSSIDPGKHFSGSSSSSN